MATKRLPRPRDPAQLAKFIIDVATGEVEDTAGKSPNRAKVDGRGLTVLRQNSD